MVWPLFCTGFILYIILVFLWSERCYLHYYICFGTIATQIARTSISLDFVLFQWKPVFEKVTNVFSFFKLECLISFFSHIFLWIVDTDKRMKLTFKKPVDLKYFSIFCRFSYGSYGCSHSRRHQPGLPITLYSSFLLIWKWKLPFIKHWRQFLSPGYGPRFVFSLKQRNKKIPLYLNTVTFGIIYLR